MNTIRDLKQQEKYTNMLKRKNKEKNIYKSKNSTLRIEKMNLIKAVERKDKEIERLNKDLETSIEICNNRQKEIVRLNNIINELEEGLKSLYDFDKGVVSEDYLDCVDDTLDKLQELKGSDK